MKPDMDIEGVLRAYERPLLRYTTHLVGGNVEIAQEVVQEAFLKLIQQKQEVITKGYIGQWLYTVCRNSAFDVLKKEKTMKKLKDEQIDQHEGGSASGALSELETKEQLSAVMVVLNQLPPNQQECLRLKFQNELSYKEISEVTNLSVTNVGFLIHTGLKAIREQTQNLAVGGN